jgi:hypothetical protein
MAMGGKDHCVFYFLKNGDVGKGHEDNMKQTDALQCQPKAATVNSCVSVCVGEEGGPAATSTTGQGCEDRATRPVCVCVCVCVKEKSQCSLFVLKYLK